MSLKHLLVLALSLFTLVPATADELVVEKGDWPLVGESVADQLDPVPSMTHVYRIRGWEGDRLTLTVRSREFPPIIVVHESGRFVTPVGLFVYPDGLPTDEYGRTQTLTFKIDGEWVTKLEAHLQEDQDLVLLVGRNPVWQHNGQGFPLETAGGLGGSYAIDGANWR